MPTSLAAHQRSKVVVVEGVRTPFVRARTVFEHASPAFLGGVALREVVQRSGVPTDAIEETVFGIVSTPPEGTNVAREAMFDSGLSPRTPAVTVNRYCASSLEAISMVASKIDAGLLQCALAGGVESISSVRAVFSAEATGFFQRLGSAKTITDRLKLLGQLRPSMLKPLAPGIKEPTTGLTMGQSADLMARLFGISRRAQDEFALQSHQRAAQGWKDGFFKTHVCQVTPPGGKVVEKDTDVRTDSKLEKLQSLKPVFYKDGTISAGNASPLTDGASALLLMHEERAKQLQLPILGRIRAIETAAVDIREEPLLIGPAYAMHRALQRSGLEWKDIQLFEIHEAFAAQVLATLKAVGSDTFCKEKLGLSRALGDVDPEKLNPYGGSIAIGHPFGATGGRLVTQAFHALRQRKEQFALLSVCAAGGLGMVAILEAGGA